VGDSHAQISVLLGLFRFVSTWWLWRGEPAVLVELNVVEQRYRAVLEVLDGATVTDVAIRYGVVRQTVHGRLRRYANDGGLGGLSDRSSKPTSCPHQMSPLLEATIVAMRRAHPAWGPDRIRWQLERDGVCPLPGRTSVYRALVRHGLVEATKRKRRRVDYRRWERTRSMALWQMDVMGRAYLSDGREMKLVTGLDDHSRYVISAKVVGRATARPVCDALTEALARHGVPEQILTDNGKVFTARFGCGPGPVMFDKICHDNGIKHLLTAPYSPTTTGKIERFHKTLRAEFLTEHDGKHVTVEQLQAAVDAWVIDYNTQRPHQSGGGRPPVERFDLTGADITALAPAPMTLAEPKPQSGPRPAGVSRWADARGNVSLATFTYPVGATFAGEPVEVVVSGGLVEIFHADVLIATHVQRVKTEHSDRVTKPRRPEQRHARPPTTGLVVTRIADSSGSVSFAGTPYRCGMRWARQPVQVSIVAGSVQLAKDGHVIRIHPIRHDRSRELGAFANPKGRPRRQETA
jgi:transposase InsO family protein